MWNFLVRGVMGQKDTTNIIQYQRDNMEKMKLAFDFWKTLWMYEEIIMF